MIRGAASGDVWLLRAASRSSINRHVMSALGAAPPGYHARLARCPALLRLRCTSPDQCFRASGMARCPPPGRRPPSPLSCARRTSLVCASQPRRGVARDQAVFAPPWGVPPLLHIAHMSVIAHMLAELRAAPPAAGRPVSTFHPHRPRSGSAFMSFCATRRRLHRCDLAPVRSRTVLMNTTRPAARSRQRLTVVRRSSS